jgi:hypothetical protein
MFVLLGVGGLGLGVSANSLVLLMTEAMPNRYAGDLSGVITTSAQLAGALGVAVTDTVYTGMPADAATTFALVLMGFTALAAGGAIAAGRALG